MATRQQLLERVRRALARAPGESSTPSDLRAWPELGKVLEPIPPESLLARFEQELGKVGATAYRARKPAEIEGALAGILTDRLGQGVVLSRNPLLARLGIAPILESMGAPVWTWPAAALTGLPPADAKAFRERCFTAAAGVTGVDFALAESGSLVLTSLSEGSQLASLAPPVHIALYLRSQLVESLEEVLAGLEQRQAAGSTAAGRSVVFVTGTSRTADIEQILIRGVHGPRELHAILIDD